MEIEKSENGYITRLSPEESILYIYKDVLSLEQLKDYWIKTYSELFDRCAKDIFNQETDDIVKTKKDLHNALACVEEMRKSIQILCDINDGLNKKLEDNRICIAGTKEVMDKMNTIKDISKTDLEKLIKCHRIISENK